MTPNQIAHSVAELRAGRVILVNHLDLTFKIHGKPSKLCSSVIGYATVTDDRRRLKYKMLDADQLNQWLESLELVSDDDWTTADHCEAWAIENGRKLPKRGTPEFEKLYVDWHTFAFRDF